MFHIPHMSTAVRVARATLALLAFALVAIVVSAPAHASADAAASRPALRPRRRSEPIRRQTVPPAAKRTPHRPRAWH